MYRAILYLDAAVAGETIADLDDAAITFSGSGPFKEGVQEGGDRVLGSAHETLHIHIVDALVCDCGKSV